MSIQKSRRILLFLSSDRIPRNAFLFFSPVFTNGNDQRRLVTYSSVRLIFSFEYNSAVQNQRPSKQIENTLTICSRFEQTNDDTIASKILLMLIEWIRHLPIFYHLSIHDQVFELVKY